MCSGWHCGTPISHVKMPVQASVAYFAWKHSRKWSRIEFPGKDGVLVADFGLIQPFPLHPFEH